MIVGFAVSLISLLIGISPANAMVLDPLAFPSLGSLTSSDPVTINTDTLQLNGSNSFTGVLDPLTDTAIFAFNDIHTQAITVEGNRSLALLSHGNTTLNGPFSLLGSGGLEIGTVGTLAMGNLTMNGNGGGIVLYGNQLDLTGSIYVRDHTLFITNGDSLRATKGIDEKYLTTGGRAGTGFLLGNHSAGLITSRGGAHKIQPAEIRDVNNFRLTPGIGIISVGTTSLAPVPLPTAAPLFLSGVTALWAIRRQRNVPHKIH